MPCEVQRVWKWTWEVQLKSFCDVKRPQRNKGFEFTSAKHILKHSQHTFTTKGTFLDVSKLPKSLGFTISFFWPLVSSQNRNLSHRILLSEYRRCSEVLRNSLMKNSYKACLFSASKPKVSADKTECFSSSVDEIPTMTWGSAATRKEDLLFPYSNNRDSHFQAEFSAQSRRDQIIVSFSSPIIFPSYEQ